VFSLHEEHTRYIIEGNGPPRRRPLRGGKFTTVSSLHRRQLVHATCSVLELTSVLQWEGGVRGVAFFISPLIPPALRGSNVSGLSHACDWAPTLLQIAGVPVSALGTIDGVSLLPMILGGRAVRTEIPHVVSKVNGTGVLRVGDYKLVAGFPGESTKSGCHGGCWCPVPDPETGIQTCIPPLRSADGELRSSEVEAALKPPSASCAAAMNATGCGRVRPSTSKACNRCALNFNRSLAKAGCCEKCPKHWCNNEVGPPSPPPPPSPSPPAPGPPDDRPCAAAPCLFDISRE
jgi:hypothetical protein